MQVYLIYKQTRLAMQVYLIYKQTRLAMQVSSVECRVSGIECRVSSVECRVSSVEYRTQYRHRKHRDLFSDRISVEFLFLSPSIYFAKVQIHVWDVSLMLLENCSDNYLTFYAII